MPVPATAGNGVVGDGLPVAEPSVADKRAEVGRYLAAHDYRIAAVTMSFGDYLWNEPYARCMAKRDDAAIASLE